MPLDGQDINDHHRVRIDDQELLANDDILEAAIFRHNLDDVRGQNCDMDRTGHGDADIDAKVDVIDARNITVLDDDALDLRALGFTELHRPAVRWLALGILLGSTTFLRSVVALRILLGLAAFLSLRIFLLRTILSLGIQVALTLGLCALLRIRAGFTLRAALRGAVAMLFGPALYGFLFGCAALRLHLRLCATSARSLSVLLHCATAGATRRRLMLRSARRCRAATTVLFLRQRAG